MPWLRSKPDQKLPQNNRVGTSGRFAFEYQLTGNIGVDPGCNLIRSFLNLFVQHLRFLLTQLRKILFSSQFLGLILTVWDDR